MKGHTLHTMLGWLHISVMRDGIDNNVSWGPGTAGDLGGILEYNWVLFVFGSVGMEGGLGGCT